MTETRVQIGGKRLSQYTVRCGSPECWFVGHGGTSVDAQFVLDEHKCPTPPVRNELPTGRSTLEKLWDEMDDVTTALIDGTDYNGMVDATLKGYARGIAFNLSMVTHPYFRTIREISREAGARYKMSKGTIPWRPTPSYNYNPMPAPFTGNVVRTTPAVKRAPTKRTPGKPAAVKLADGMVQAIKSGHAAGMFTLEELASMYSATVDQVKLIVG